VKNDDEIDESQITIKICIQGLSIKLRNKIKPKTYTGLLRFLKGFLKLKTQVFKDPILQSWCAGVCTRSVEAKTNSL